VEAILAPAGADARSFRHAPRWFLAAVLVLSFVGLATRIAMVAFVHEPAQPGFLVDYDPIFYSQQANLVADGHGFIAPYLLDAQGNGPHRPSAGHPPLLVVVLAAATKLGARSFGAHRVVVALLGAAVVPVLALLGAELGGWRTGVIAAAIAAVYPNLWLYDGLLMPEALAGLLVALALLVSVRFVRTGRRSLLIWLGVIIGLGALTRGELLFLVPLLVFPICLARRQQSVPERLRLAGLAAVVAALVIAPWAIYNVQRFEKPVFISTAQDTTIGGANCDVVYHGSSIGAWSDQCFSDILNRNLEESVAASEIRSRSAHYVAGHTGRLPLVALARFGRTWDLFKPASNVTLGELQRRPRVWSWIALAMYGVLVVLACLGGYRSRRDPALLPLLAMPVLVTLTGVLFWGNPRFRRPAELVIVVLAAVAIDAFAGRGEPVPVDAA
jgi:4-amino-4-deoxy-L-arabinose transferase-like glycosyltransferase